ncbi:MAG: hypothetical protein QOK37_2501 [Thermoanaerobaculia bacterium]|jgi:hypothetical protein|nr:hypothetical protein [Thermoanaerobaculia bacterium]
MSITDAVGAGEVLQILMQGASTADVQGVRGEAAAIQNAVGVINRRLEEIEKRLVTLEKRIATSRQLAVLLKAVSLLGGIFILSGLAPTAVPYISVAIALSSAADLLLGNHRRLIGFLDEKNGLQSLKDSVADADTAATAVLRLIGKDWREAVKKYADFMQELQISVLKGYKEVQAASRRLEREVTAALEVSQSATQNTGRANSTGE